MMKLLRKVLIGGFSIALLAGCAGEEDTIIMAPVPVVDDQFSLDTQWSSSIGNGVEHYYSKLKPAYGYGKVFVASRDGVVSALDPDNGKRIWSQSLDSNSIARLSGGLTLSYGKVFVGSENGEIIALDQESGEELWRSTIDGEVLSTPLADEGLVIVHSSRGVLYAFDADTGSKKWQISSEVPSLTLRGDSSPVSISGGVFWGMSNGRLAAALISKGQLLWQQPIGMPKGSTEIDRIVDVDSTPLIIGGRLFTIGFNGQLVALELRTGKAAWKRNYSSVTDLVTDGGRIFVVTENDYVVAVDARSGTELWKNKQLENRLLTAPVLIQGKLVVGDSEGYLHWLSREDGSFVAQQQINDSGLTVAPILVDDSFVVTSRDGKLKKMKIN
ncbi:MAG: outer membrane protein assembly factor BamB [Aliivibrio sp.]|uniref:outer membrane protein assembly factor BamB n=1 Tax=Aliivibrio sp. TaxID=1872443 RepID=UPI001A3A078B|nr:outer membrane protein assembly factor BamB [Aliivibrio sp.]